MRESQFDPKELKIGETTEGLRVYRCTSCSPLFQLVLEARAEVYGEAEPGATIDSFDGHSEQYVALGPGGVTYAMRATRDSKGPIECQEYYPRQLLEVLKDKVVSAGRFFRKPGIRTTRKASIEFIALAWADQVRLGSRLDVINATERLLRYYQRLGYVRHETGTFRHPRWHTESHVLFMPADPSRTSPLQGAFSKCADPLTLERLQEALRPITKTGESPFLGADTSDTLALVLRRSRSAAPAA